MDEENNYDKIKNMKFVDRVKLSREMKPRINEAKKYMPYDLNDMLNLLDVLLQAHEELINYVMMNGDEIIQIDEDQINLKTELELLNGQKEKFKVIKQRQIFPKDIIDKYM